MSRIADARVVRYPDSDGKPMGETPRHVTLMLQTYGTLDQWFEADERVFVGCNNFVYYQEGNPRKHVSPDVYVVKEIAKNRQPERRNYKTWEEGKGLDWVLEVTSKSTRKEDLETKFALYRDVLCVQEYFLFDPYGEYLRPAFQGYRRDGERFVLLSPNEGRLESQILGLILEEVGNDLRLIDPATGNRLKTMRELHAENMERTKAMEELRHENEERARQEARLKEEIARLKENVKSAKPRRKKKE